MDNIRIGGSVQPPEPAAAQPPLGTQLPMPAQPTPKITSEPGVYPVTIDIADLQAQCVRDGIKLIRQCFLNNSGGILREKGCRFGQADAPTLSGTLATYLVPTHVFFRRHAVKGRGLVPVLQSLPIGQDDPVWETFSNGIIDLTKEVDFKPDWTTFRYLPHAPGHAFCLGITYSRGLCLNPAGYVYRQLIRGPFRDSAPIETNDFWELDPRNVLRRLTNQLKEKYGLKMICGTESEFVGYFP